MTAGPDRWIIVRNWEKFQHRDAFRSRTPTWIKFFTELHHDDDYLSLSGHDRAILSGIWVEYALSRGQLRLDTVSLSRRLNLRVSTQTLERLNQAGYITFSASKPARIVASTPASPEQIGEEEKEKGLSSTSTEDPDSNGLPINKELEVLKLLGEIGDHADDGTAHVIRHRAGQLSVASLVRVRESVAGHRPRNRAAYVVAALDDELSLVAAADEDLAL